MHLINFNLNFSFFRLSCLEGKIQLQIMAHRFSKEELDEQFEEFLKEVCLRTRSHACSLF